MHAGDQILTVHMREQVCGQKIKMKKEGKKLWGRVEKL